MPFAARITDITDHPGQIQGPGVATVTIGGLKAAVVGDLHVCAFPVTPPVPPHPTTAIVEGSASVSIGGRAAARLGDHVICGASIVTGAFTVSIGD